MKKQKMIKGRAPEGLAAKEPSYEERVAAAMGASADTAATAVEREEMEAFILRDWQRKAARFDEIKGKLLADAEKDPLSALRWADDAARDLAEAAIYRDALIWKEQGAKRVEELARDLYEHLSRQLLANSFRPNSSSAFSNASEIARGEATSRVCENLKSCLGWFGKAGI